MTDQLLKFSSGDNVKDYQSIIKNIKQVAIPKEFMNSEWDVDSVIHLHLDLREEVENEFLSIMELQKLEHALFTTPFSKSIIEPFGEDTVGYTVLKPGQSVEKYINVPDSHNKTFQFEATILDENGSHTVVQCDERTMDIYWVVREFIDRRTYEAIIVPRKEDFIKRLRKLF